MEGVVVFETNSGNSKRIREGILLQLSDIQESVQQIADAIASVLKVEVEIADHNLLRVAGTGKAKTNVLRTMAGEDHVYQSALRQGDPVIIRNPGFNEICKPCIHFGNCNETGEICCPIHVAGKSVGVIGLLAFDKEQRKRLFEDDKIIINFLRKIAELISTKLVEYEIYQEQQATVKQLTTVMNYLEQGVIAIDQGGKVSHLNSQARNLLKITHLSHIEEELQANLKYLLEVTSGTSDPIEVSLTIKDEERTFWVSNSPIEVNGKSMGAVITIDDLQRIETLVNKWREKEDEDPFGRIIGTSNALLYVKEQAKKIAGSDSTVLIQGESGTGKELFAQAIHQASNRAKKVFLSINCGAIPENLLESELFGYAEGAFTGARKGGKMGKIEQANGGTLFLDEIGDMPLHLQVKLLRFLQERQIERIGSTGSPIRVNIRIIAATNQNLAEMVAKKQFREDLFYRLNVIPLTLPPLRERKEDVLLISSFFLQKYNRQLGKNIRGILPQARRALLHYEWPGNVRELSNSLEFSVNMEMSEFITYENLPHSVKKKSPERTDLIAQGPPSHQELNLRQLEKKTIQHALKLVSGKPQAKELAAELLGISRATLFRKLKEFQI